MTWFYMLMASIQYKHSYAYVFHVHLTARTYMSRWTVNTKRTPKKGTSMLLKLHIQTWGRKCLMRDGMTPDVYIPHHDDDRFRPMTHPRMVRENVDCVWRITGNLVQRACRGIGCILTYVLIYRFL